MAEPNPDQPVATAIDARNRAARTFIQNLLLDVLVAVLLLLWPAVSAAQSMEDFNWSLLAFSFVKTILVTVVSYIMRALGVSPQTTTS